MKKLAKRIWQKCPDRWDAMGMAGIVSVGAGVFLMAGWAWTFLYSGAVLTALGYAGSVIQRGKN